MAEEERAKEKKIEKLLKLCSKLSEEDLEAVIEGMKNLQKGKEMVLLLKNYSIKLC